MDELLLDVGPQRVAQVAIERGIDRYPEGLTYALPADLESIPVGSRVVVPLGPSNTPTPGWVLRIQTHEDAVALAPKLDATRLKAVLSADTSGAQLPKEILALAEWISGYYACPIGMTLASMLPAAVRKGSGRVNRHFVEPTDTTPALDDLPPRFGRGQKKILEVLHELPKDELPIEINQLAERAGIRTKGPIRALLDQGFLVGSTRSAVQASWLERSSSLEAATTPPEPTPAQQNAVEAIGATLDGGFSRHLLFGVTGSGKTEVYIRLIEQVIAQGKTALVLVPEIALTPQTAGRLFARFPGRTVALLHSGLTAAQRNEQWTMAASGQAEIVLGARSAIFAPIPDGSLGLIVVDEEHDGSYKQDQAPRYNGRDVAIRRAQLAGCPIVLGSATPSLETWHNTVDLGRIQLHRLPERAPGLNLPRVDIVDFAEEQRAWNDRRIHLMGPRLTRALVETIKSGAQALILLNRRGYGNYIACPDMRCGWVMRCEQCDAGMVNHRSNVQTRAGADQSRPHDFVRCHHCLTEQRLPEKCPLCGRKVIVFGLGTQRAEQEIGAVLAPLLEPSQIRRVDSDSMRGAAAFHETLDLFAREHIRVLLGTQMIAKGLDFPKVRLVGVINADTALNLPDFRATERTYQLVSQVTGRCGRGTEPGVSIIQTFQPDSPAIRTAAQHDFEAFAQGELAERNRFHLPPIRRMARIVIRDTDEHACTQEATRVAAALRPLLNPDEVELQAPEPCAISRIGGRFRMQLLILAQNAQVLRSVLLEARQRGIIVPGERVAVDVDPLTLM